MLRLMRNCLKDERGVSLIEFALIAPFLGILTVGMADLGMGYAHRFKVQQAVNRTLELAQLGATQADYSYLRDEAAAAAQVPVGQVTLTQWLECNSGTARPFADSCNSGEEVDRYIRLTVVSYFDPMFSTAGYPNVQADGTVRLEANATLRVQ